MPRLARQEPAPGPAALPLKVAEELSLLDQVGRLARRVPAAEVRQWKRELSGKSETGKPSPTAAAGKARKNGPSPERVARLHLWLGEHKLAANEDPVGAAWHFRTIQKLVGSGEGLARVKGRAVFDLAIARFFQGAYEDATHRFQALLSPKTARPGYSRRECALWLKHASACFGYHERRAKAGITEPEQIDDPKTILRNGGGYFNPATRSYIIYSNRIGQGAVVNTKTGEIVTVLSKGARPAHWPSIGRGVFENVLK